MPLAYNASNPDRRCHVFWWDNTILVINLKNNTTKTETTERLSVGLEILSFDDKSNKVIYNTVNTIEFTYATGQPTEIKASLLYNEETPHKFYVLYVHSIIDSNNVTPLAVCYKFEVVKNSAKPSGYELKNLSHLNVMNADDWIFTSRISGIISDEVPFYTALNDKGNPVVFYMRKGKDDRFDSAVANNLIEFDFTNDSSPKINKYSMKWDYELHSEKNLSYVFGGFQDTFIDTYNYNRCTWIYSSDKTRTLRLPDNKLMILDFRNVTRPPQLPIIDLGNGKITWIDNWTKSEIPGTGGVMVLKHGIVKCKSISSSHSNSKYQLVYYYIKSDGSYEKTVWDSYHETSGFSLFLEIRGKLIAIDLSSTTKEETPRDIFYTCTYFGLNGEVNEVKYSSIDLFDKLSVQHCFVDKLYIQDNGSHQDYMVQNNKLYILLLSYTNNRIIKLWNGIPLSDLGL